MKVLLAVLCVLASVSVFAEEVPGEIINRSTCTSGKDVRDLEIVSKGDGHVLNYTKAGTVREMATCSVDLDKCQAVFDNIKSNLEQSGYICK